VVRESEVFVKDYAKRRVKCVVGFDRAVVKLASCCLSLMRRNSVFEVFKVSRFAGIQEEIML